MVSSKLEIKFIGNKGARCKVFKRRVDGVKQKYHQLSQLCDVDVFFLCSAPAGEKEMSPHTWPPNMPEVLRILTRYRNQRDGESLKHATTLRAKTSKESLPNLMHKISSKREEARQRFEVPDPSSSFDDNINGFGFNGCTSNNYLIHHAREEFSQCLLPTCEGHKKISPTDPSSSLSSVDYSSVPLRAPSPSPSSSSNVLLPPVSDFQPHTNSLIGEFWGSDDYLVEQFQGNGCLFFPEDKLVGYQWKFHGLNFPFLKVDEGKGYPQILHWKDRFYRNFLNFVK